MGEHIDFVVKWWCNVSLRWHEMGTYESNARAQTNAEWFRDKIGSRYGVDARVVVLRRSTAVMPEE
jgi:hypothetical protein